MNTKNGFTHRSNKFIVVGLIAMVILSVVTVVFSFFIPSKPESSLGRTGSGVGSPSQSNAEPQAKREQMNVNVDGHWMGDLGDARFEATVADQVITVTMTNNGTTMIYWCGSFPTIASVGNIVTSTRIELDKAVLSTAASKTFQVRSNSLVFEFKMMGKTENVELVRG